MSWSSWTQKCFTLSTTEAEYAALSDIMKEVLFPRQVWRFMLPGVGMPYIPVFEDNEGVVQLAGPPLPIATRSTFTCDTTSSGNYCSTEERHVGHPRIICFPACRFLDESNRSGLFEIPPRFCGEFVKIFAVIFDFRVERRVGGKILNECW